LKLSLCNASKITRRKLASHGPFRIRIRTLIRLKNKLVEVGVTSHTTFLRPFVSRVTATDGGDSSAGLYGPFGSSPNRVAYPASELDGPRLVGDVSENLGNDGESDDDEASVYLPQGPDGDGSERVRVVCSRLEEQYVVVDSGNGGCAGTALWLVRFEGKLG